MGQVALSPAAEAALAPALLPRGYWNMRLLQAIQEVRAVCVCVWGGACGCDCVPLEGGLMCRAGCCWTTPL